MWVSGEFDRSDQPLAPPVLRYVGARLPVTGALLDGQDRVFSLAQAVTVEISHESTHLELVFLDCADVHHVVPGVDDCFLHSRPSTAADCTTVASRYWLVCMYHVIHGILE